LKSCARRLSCSTKTGMVPSLPRSWAPSSATWASSRPPRNSTWCSRKSTLTVHAHVSILVDVDVAKKHSNIVTVIYKNSFRKCVRNAQNYIILNRLNYIVKVDLFITKWITCLSCLSFDLSTPRPKWRLDGPDLLGHLLYSLVNHAYANRYHHHLVR